MAILSQMVVLLTAAVGQCCSGALLANGERF